MIGVQLLAYVVALICFIIAAIGVPTGRVSLIAVGLAFLDLALMWPMLAK